MKGNWQILCNSFWYCSFSFNKTFFAETREKNKGCIFYSLDCIKTFNIYGCPIFYLETINDRIGLQWKTFKEKLAQTLKKLQNDAKTQKTILSWFSNCKPRKINLQRDVSRKKLSTVHAYYVVQVKSSCKVENVDQNLWMESKFLLEQNNIRYCTS